MPILQIYVDTDTLARLTIAAAELNRSVDELAESAVAEAAIQAVPKVNGLYARAAHAKIARGLT